MRGANVALSFAFSHLQTFKPFPLPAKHTKITKLVKGIGGLIERYEIEAINSLLWLTASVPVSVS